MWLLKVFSAICFAASCATQSSGDVPSVLLLTKWSDVFLSEKVTLKCNISSSSEYMFIWSRNGQEITASDPNVLLPGDGSLLTMTMGAPEQSSGSYTCKAYHNATGNLSKARNFKKLTVHQSKPKPTVAITPMLGTMYPGESINFTCSLGNSPGWEFIWEHNSTEIAASGRTHTIKALDYSDSGNYMCIAKRGEDPFYTDKSAAKSLLVSEIPIPELTQMPTWEDVFRNELVQLFCNSDSNEWSIVWYRNGVQLQNDDTLEMAEDDPFLNITAAKEHEGVYLCSLTWNSRKLSSQQSKTARIKVYDQLPNVTLHKDPAFDTMFVGELVTFTCNMNVPTNMEYKWFRDGSIFSPESGNTVTFPLGASSGGKYSCQANRGATEVMSEERLQHVIDRKPKPSLTQQPNDSKVYTEEAVNLTCNVGLSTGWQYVWFKDGDQLQVKHSSYIIKAASGSHSGVYKCMAIRNQTAYTTEYSDEKVLKILDIPVPVLQPLTQWLDVFPTEHVKMNCAIKGSSDWRYEWEKDGRPLLPSQVESFDSDKSILSISGASASHHGEYSCSAVLKGRLVTSSTSEKLTLNVYHLKPKPLLTQQPDDNRLYTGETVKLTCNVGLSTGWQYVWFKDGDQLQVKHSSYIIKAANGYHSGVYKCMANRNQTTYTTEYSDEQVLKILEIPVPVLQPLTQWMDVFPTERVNMSCAIKGSSDWRYEWEKDGQRLLPSHVESFDSDESILSISGASAAHRGEYSCSAVLKRRSVSSAKSPKQKLDVYDWKPKPSLTQQPNDSKVYTEEAVNLTCNVGLSTGWQYVWFKDGDQLQVKHSSYIIKAANGSHSGVYMCMAIRNLTTYTTEYSDEQVLKILEIPVPVLQPLTQWLDVFPTEGVKMSCAIKGSSDWRYKWEKDGRPLLPSQVESFDSDESTLIISGASASHHGEYSCSAVLKGRLVTSSTSEKLRLNVYDTKPRVTILKNPDHDEIYTEDKVSFNCHINISSGWEFLWFKDSQRLAETSSNHSITSVWTGNSGSYQCEVKRGSTMVFKSDSSPSARLNVHERPMAYVNLLTGWSEVFSTDSLALQCGVESPYDWNYTWYKNDHEINGSHSSRHIVTPQNDPEQGLYKCKGVRSGRPLYSKYSEPLKTRNFLLKRRVLLAISGCILFGIAVTILGCIILRVFRKPAKDEYKPDENDLFLPMNHLQDCEDGPCPLVQYITNAALNSSKEEDNNGLISSETTPLQITSQDDQDLKTESQQATETIGGLASFKCPGEAPAVTTGS